MYSTSVIINSRETPRLNFASFNDIVRTTKEMESAKADKRLIGREGLLQILFAAIVRTVRTNRIRKTRSIKTKSLVARRQKARRFRLMDREGNFISGESVDVTADTASRAKIDWSSRAMKITRSESASVGYDPFFVVSSHLTNRNLVIS